MSNTTSIDGEQPPTKTIRDLEAEAYLKTLRGPSKFVLVYLARLSHNNEPTPMPSLAMLARACGYSRHAMLDASRKLRDSGYLLFDMNTNSYTLCLDPDGERPTNYWRR